MKIIKYGYENRESLFVHCNGIENKYLVHNLQAGTLKEIDEIIKEHLQRLHRKHSNNLMFLNSTKMYIGLWQIANERM